MHIYNLIYEPDLDLSLIHHNEENLIIVDHQELIKLKPFVDLAIHEIIKDNEEFPIFFTSGIGYDFFSFLFIEENCYDIEYKKVSLILMKQKLIVVCNKDTLVRYDLYKSDGEAYFDSLTVLYFSFMEIAFSEMFTQMCAYEEHLQKIESQLIIGKKDYDIKEIIHEKNVCLTAKKYAQQLYLSGEDMKLNLNGLIPDEDMRMLPNIGAKIGLLKEMTNHLTEMSTHLLEVYDSTVNTKTNHAVNKLAVFNFFATPITIISGIYGMNFVNMPELTHPYGYTIVIGLMIGISIIIYKYLRKLKLL